MISHMTLFNEGARQLAGSLRHAPARRPHRRPARHRSHRRRRPGVHRAPGHVLPRDRRRRGLNRSAPTRAEIRGSSAFSTSARSRSRATTATACSSRSATSTVNPLVGLLFVDFDGRRRLRLNGVASSSDDDELLVVVPGSTGDRARRRHSGLPELPALHPSARACRGLTVCPPRGMRDADSRLEAPFLVA